MFPKLLKQQQYLFHLTAIAANIFVFLNCVSSNNILLAAIVENSYFSSSSNDNMYCPQHR